jgi:hypothetical protein
VKTTDRRVDRPVASVARIVAGLGLVLLAGGTARAECRGDFNGDGFSDLAIGVPGETISGIRCGAVNVLYGSASFLTSTGNQRWHQSVTGVPGSIESGDGFGFALAVGDFDGDGFDDLAIGVSEEDVGTIQSAGAVNVLYGSASGLGTARAQLWTQTSSGAGVSETADRFGLSLAAGDFDGDGRDDLAIGVPFEDVGSAVGAGAVNVLYGTANGLSTLGSQDWTENSISGTAADTGDQFGRALAVGDFDGDGRDDLAVGAPGETLLGQASAGAVIVMRGGSNGLVATGAQLWSQNATGIAGAGEAGDRFGYSLTAGDFNGDGYDDLAAGVPFEDVGGGTDAGAVNVVYGSAAGLTANGSQLLFQDPNILDSEDGDHFGWSLAAGDATGDGRAELVIGVPGENTDRGAIQAFRGTATGLVRLRTVGARVQGGSQPGDRFAEALAVGDFDGNGRCEVVAGTPRDDVGTIADAGSITMLSTTVVQHFHQDTTGILGTAAVFDSFGFALGAGGR